MVGEVEMDAYVDVFLVDYVRPVVVESCIKLLGGKTYVLFLAMGACDEVDEIGGGAGEAVSE